MSWKENRVNCNQGDLNKHLHKHGKMTADHMWLKACQLDLARDNFIQLTFELPYSARFSRSHENALAKKNKNKKLNCFHRKFGLFPSDTNLKSHNQL